MRTLDQLMERYASRLQEWKDLKDSVVRLEREKEYLRSRTAEAEDALRYSQERCGAEIEQLQRRLQTYEQHFTDMAARVANPPIIVMDRGAALQAGAKLQPRTPTRIAFMPDRGFFVNYDDGTSEKLHANQVWNDRFPSFTAWELRK